MVTLALLVRADLYRMRGSWREAYQDYQRILAIDQNSDQAAEAANAIEHYVLAARETEKTVNAQRARASRPGHEKSLPEAASPEDIQLYQPSHKLAYNI